MAAFVKSVPLKTELMNAASLRSAPVKLIFVTLQIVALKG
jgi:hypothetical protein